MTIRWGLVATVLGPPAELLQFAAYHLEAGAHRIYLYLDDPDSDAFAPLKAHPKVRVSRCDAQHWQKLGGKRPEKHQVRQSRNATHAYSRRTEVDWLIHMDADEFLVSDQPVGDILAALPESTLTARVRPMEQLAGDGHRFKAFIPNGPEREKIVNRIYPTFGPHIKGGFLSHVAGKLFARTGMDGLDVRIHNVFLDQVMNPDEVELSQIDLAHCHAKTWQDWLAAYRYRLEKGSYRAELAPATPPEAGGLSLHDLFRFIEADSGETGLREFYREVAEDSPELRARLDAEGLLRTHRLNVDEMTSLHFPDFTT
ncbi:MULTISPECIES: glycosyltransferase family 2 protein [Roseobacteraceae]|uniref:Glycosyl transferase family 2 n=1 Tax=Pseudosulfitobacter pseudonitzschiae TaxID=1402135 RepID=A0A221K0Z5_9RHOB|nr:MULTISPECIES: glycosyltransferase family 2 protein [Roseobacteraceae]ASM72651.1 glycosyl transferase family 2 [Pseudosulfitobacter pseudonitzschiae]